MGSIFPFIFSFSFFFSFTTTTKMAGKPVPVPTEDKILCLKDLEEAAAKKMPKAVRG